MGVITDQLEVSCALPAAKMFKGFVVEADDIFPKVMPQAIKSAELIEGDGGPGSIRKVNIVAGDKPAYLKQKVDALDKESFSFSYTIFEGEILDNKFEKICHESKWESSPNGGSIFKSTAKFYTLPGFEGAENFISNEKQRAIALIKAVEAHLQAN
ncbi:major allergen Pru av 1-like [Pistacia vera]|uniref:major allergen Pru av 1-like n=1 Tax=Pistacia vera TaxID=55513 RepID=UPI00126315D6|nr:major allergen Pru av 1-like [Pistacia vera]